MSETESEIGTPSRRAAKLTLAPVVASVLHRLFWVRWRLRIDAGPLVIQYLLYGLFLVHFLWRTMHDISASNLWKDRLDRYCGPIAGKGNSGGVYFFDYDWGSHATLANGGTNSAAAWWLIGFLPILYVPC